MSKQVTSKVFGTSGPNVSSIGQGTWMIEHDPKQAVRALQHGLDLGLSHIDTAEMYGDGKAEQIVGKAIAGRRHEVFLVSKVLPSHASQRDTLKACEASLQRLGTDVLDCYLLHWRSAVPLAETFAAFEQLQQQGKIRSYGVSNFDVSDLQEALALVGTGKLACNQVLYHLQERAIEHAVLPWCAQHKVAVVAYSPFGHNQFPTARSAGGALLAQLAQRYAATPQQIALAFLTRHANVFAIPKAMQLPHVTANATQVQLSTSDIDVLAAVFSLGPKPRYLPMI